MNYSKFCHYEAPLHMLTKREIEQPFLVLDDLCKKRTMEDFQNELMRILSMFFKEEAWANHDPGVIYECYEDLVRLIDVLYLINKYSPALSSIKHGKAVSNVEKKMTTLNRIFKKRATEEPERSGEEQTMLNYFYHSCHIGFLKIDLNYCLQIVLDASYMPSDKYYYFGLDQSDFLFNLYRLYDLIAEGYSIYARGKSAFPVLESCPELTFARDKNHPTHLSEECLSMPMGVVRDFYQDYVVMNHLHASLKAWKRMLFVTDFWKNEESPGNLIYLQNTIATLIDACWLSDRKGQFEPISSGRYDCGKKSKKMIKKCSKEEQKFPLLVIKTFLAFKSVHEWKHLLDEWLQLSLSNSRAYDDEKKPEVNKDFKILIKFMEAVYLITCPKIVNQH